jgi:predicted phage terminase large subunit-like protein
LLDFPAIALENDALGRPIGSALWPEVRDIAFLEEQRAAMGTRRFNAQFQGRPSPEDGSLFRREWFGKTYQALPNGLKRGVIFCDGAWKTGLGNDRSALAAWVTNGRDYFIVDAWAGRVEYPDLKTKAAAFWDRNRNLTKTMRFCVEDAASGIPLIQELKRSTDIPIIGARVDASKYVRAEAVTPEFESGRVYLPASAPWVDEWVEEHVNFPTAKHDDFVDTTSGALAKLKAGGGGGMAFAIGRNIA